MHFFNESGLIAKKRPFLDLNGADLRGAYLRGADLKGAILAHADLREANLTDALGLIKEQLETAESLEGATMPNGQKYEDWLKDKEDQGKDVEHE